MLHTIRPHLQLPTVLELNRLRLEALGLRGLLLDVDCTLTDHAAPEFRTEVLDWASTLRSSGVRLCLLSNGREQRIGALAAKLTIPYVAQALKPLPINCHVGVRKLNLPYGAVGLVGDQVFADVLAGRLAGLYTILVHPISTHEPWFTWWKRPVERRLLSWMNRPRRAVITPGQPGPVPVPGGPVLAGPVPAAGTAAVTVTAATRETGPRRPS